MKVLKLLIILFFMQLLLFTSLSAQEEGSSNPDSSGITQTNNNSDSAPVTNDKEGNVNKEKENTVTPDLTKEKTESKEDTQKKASTKKKTEKAVTKTEEIKTEEIKTEQIKTEEIKIDKPDTAKLDGDLLLIDEGNFKYRRIPDIKLIDKLPAVAENNIVAAPPVESEQKPERSYGSDIWKILIVLIIVGIFILYMSRASNSAKISNKASKSRKVLNSYRK